jgi:hypothetical protein
MKLRSSRSNSSNSSNSTSTNSSNSTSSSTISNTSNTTIDKRSSNSNNINIKSNEKISDWPSTVIKRSDSNGICLCQSYELPSWHFQHRGIINGYRYCNNINSAIISLNYWHNESINIWMHYIAAILLFLYFLYRFDFNILNDNKYDGYVVIIITIIGNVIPMFASAFCHNFYCINKNIHKICWFFDFWAIKYSSFCQIALNFF